MSNPTREEIEQVVSDIAKRLTRWEASWLFHCYVSDITTLKLAAINSLRLEEELAKLKAEYKANLDRIGAYAKDGAPDRGVMREALKWYASNLRAEDRLNDNGERAAKALAKVKEFE